jgi:uncharacterized membrane protein YedE/YeeE
MERRLAGFIVGVVFGVTLSWTGLSSPEVIRDALLFENSYLYLFFISAVTTAFVGLRLLRVLHARAVLTGDPVDWSVDRPQRRHVAGSVLFGTGWAISGACPGPIATQLGQGVAWSLFTLVGLVLGVALFLRTRSRAPAVS